MLFELDTHGVEVARHHLAQRLGVELLAHCRRALEIGEHDRHDLSELLRRWRASASGEPQARQNFAMSGFSVAHFGQTGTRRVCLNRVRGERFAPLSNPYGPSTKSPRKGTSDTSYWTNTRVTPIPKAKGGGMFAAELETMYSSELDRIERWRHEELERAGYDPESALVLSASHDVDLHEAVNLLNRGCTVDLALQILL